VFGNIENVLDFSWGLRFIVVPGTDNFIDRVPAVFTDVSNAHVPAVLFVQDHDVGLVDPVSNDPLGTMLAVVAGSSR
jgi:hypothetical protein